MATASGGLQCPSANAESIEDRVQHDYRALIIKHVRCGSIIGRMCVPEEHQETVNNIMALENFHQQSQATKAFLDYLNTNGEPRDYNLFAQILELDGYVYVSKLLRGDDTLDPNTHKEQCRLIRFFCRDISETIDVSVLYPRLVEDDWMDDEDGQLLQRLADNNGRISAAKWLISVVLPRRKENWFKQFLQLLWDCGYNSLVELIDEDFHAINS
ncbi:uncharacterized protein LOC125380056 [Haliotis rufescens]|uniref:uncharacterized protein LOC125380056 n=1 Tax=Haliotis rufescens TaxID=6454 RepID=UPI00201F4B41|nr:uncharacterized protein LOC125380056 [Haliotis rufescens]XP_048252152.1 uncharacterized protein LOC125380056 [Haliotis rufescens]XP_048252153.1 uncharacterized protein LOC125380056 [Haliotis rufescens]